ncbi:CheY-like receiver domain-containing protein [Hoeflea sp. IMCC20628]|uniref:response regulator n=1 Tax=Hoeflea sp. IMCC20628 TaxID=1620421 RepID=UPI00063AD934|nr:response regulator [Hoeflea sp. IMCC20628]AKH98883.1 CheY-like receiver domain-containing protein [Hoeflea sp. IMCC20628]
MDRSPKILIVTDEPMLMVDMLFELEDRGFDIEPMKPGEHRSWSQLHVIDAAVFDLYQPDKVPLPFAAKLWRCRIPIVSLRSGTSVRGAGAETCLSKPVDYDRLADLLIEMTCKTSAIASYASVGALLQPEAMAVDER